MSKIITKKELSVFTNAYKKDYLIKTKKGNYVFLKYLDLISEYELTNEEKSALSKAKISIK